MFDIIFNEFKNSVYVFLAHHLHIVKDKLHFCTRTTKPCMTVPLMPHTHALSYIDKWAACVYATSRKLMHLVVDIVCMPHSHV